MMACRHLGYVVTEGPKHTTVSALLLRPIHRSAWKMNSRKFAPEAATWQMRLLPHACYHGCVVQPGGADHPALLGEQEGNVSDSTTTVRWAAASILVGGVLYALYGLLNPLLAPSLVWFLLGGNLLGAALLTAGLTGLRVYLREQGVDLGGVGRVVLWVCIVALAVWTALGLASFLVLALLGPTRLTGLAVDISDFLLVVVFVGSAMLGAGLFLRTQVVPRGWPWRW